MLTNKMRFKLEHQISILEGFLKDHVTLKTGVLILKISHFKLQYVTILLYF